jgi:hypothetical protein
MGNRKDTRVILGTLRYKSSPETTLSFPIPFVQTAKENIEFDRNINISLAQVFDDERQASSTFRPTGKFSILFSNSYTGTTKGYIPFENNLYYVNVKQYAKQECESNPDAVDWGGFPQYNEFDFIRNDYNVVGYTQSPNNHLNFISKSASTYNWNHFISYPYKNNYIKNMTYTNLSGTKTINWKSGDGLPFIITNMMDGGNKIVSFRSSVKHGLSVGEFVKLSLTYNGDSYFEVYSLGDGTSNSEYYVFNVFNYGFTSTFNDNVSGTFKRVLNIDFPNDTTSEYYVKELKLLTNPEDSVLVKTGFEQSIFGKTKKFESSGFTPNHIERVSVKEGSQSYSLTFNTDIDISPLRDNQKRPITELFFNVIYKGYFGWMFGANAELQQGYEYNLPLVKDSAGGLVPDSWWSNSNNNSKTGFQIDSYTKTSGVNGFLFYYVKSLKKGDIIDGDYCEWNSYEQKERVVSTLYHKFKYNPLIFDVRASSAISNLNLFGYYYQPNHTLTIREYSDYIENGDPANVIDIPDYAHFSTTENSFIWRDIYSYGFIDNDKIGVDYPFLNGKHYPFKDYNFRIIPEGSNFVSEDIIQDPTFDDCE